MVLPSFYHQKKYTRISENKQKYENRLIYHEGKVVLVL